MFLNLLVELLTYTIRLAKASEIYELPEVERLAALRFLPYVDELEISAEMLEGLTPISFLRRAQAEHRLWIAIPDLPKSSPIGFIAAKFLLESCFIIEISVHPAHGRKGVGSALIEACCQGTSARGLKWVSLTTFRYVPWNIPFYQKMGFEVVDEASQPSEIRAIVAHEARYGFKRKHRVVMSRALEERRP